MTAETVENTISNSLMALCGLLQSKFVPKNKITRDKKVMKIWHKDKECDKTMQGTGQNGVRKQTVLHAWSCLVLFLFYVLVFT